MVSASVVRLALLLALAQPQPRPGFGVSLGGRPLPDLASPGTDVAVLFFVASDCPVSNREFPEMLRLREKYASRAIQFRFVYPNSTETPGTVRAHQADFDHGKTDTPLTDPQGSLVALAHIHVTPEAAVLVRTGTGWQTVYHGRVDDRFVRLGLERPAPTEFFVERALQAVLAHNPVPPDPGSPTGCAILGKGNPR